MKKLICLAFVLILVPGVLAFAQANHTVRMTDEGFEPRELTVNQGESVTFVNEDNVDRWPASNFHPTHTLYPEFDPLKGISAGESWTVKFEKAGTWRMHDHLIPHMTGTITVLGNPDGTNTAGNGPATSTEESGGGLFSGIKNFFINIWKKITGGNNEASTSLGNVEENLLSEFNGLNEKEKYTWLEDISVKEDPETAWRYIKAAYETSRGVTGNPHDMAHLVGQLLFKERGFDGLSTCDPSFAFGCYHGLMEVAFDKDNPREFKANLEKANDGCEAIGTTTSPTYWSCIHGIGHGIATFREYDMELSMDDCDFLPTGFQTYCRDGVFMEFSISAPPSFYDRENPLYPCTVVAENAKSACARSQSKVMMSKFDMELKDVAATCIDSGNTNITYHCIDSLGYYVGQTSGGDEDRIILGCKTIEDNPSAAQCLAAAAGELVFQDYIGWHDSVKEICGSVEGNYRTLCEKRVEQVKKSYGRD